MALNWDMGGNDLIVNTVSVGATAPGQAGTNLSGSELTVLDGVTPGTATASKAVVLGASKDIATITTGTITNLNTTTLTPTTIAGAANFTGTPTFAAGATVTGAVTASGTVTGKSGTAVPATAGAVAAGAPISLYSTGIKIWVTSDAPTHAGSKGDICINTGGSSTSTRMYINTTGSTTWTNFTTAA